MGDMTFSIPPTQCDGKADVQQCTGCTKPKSLWQMSYFGNDPQLPKEQFTLPSTLMSSRELNFSLLLASLLLTCLLTTCFLTWRWSFSPHPTIKCSFLFPFESVNQANCLTCSDFITIGTKCGYLIWKEKKM